jgi:hypothetical protein
MQTFLISLLDFFPPIVGHWEGLFAHLMWIAKLNQNSGSFFTTQSIELIILVLLMIANSSHVEGAHASENQN